MGFFLFEMWTIWILEESLMKISKQMKVVSGLLKSRNGKTLNINCSKSERAVQLNGEICKSPFDTDLVEWCHFLHFLIQDPTMKQQSLSPYRFVFFLITSSQFWRISWSVAGTKPHIIIILADDLGYNDVSYNAILSAVKTPNIDTLAQEGVILDNYYVQPQCSPTRSQLMTGRYQVNVSIKRRLRNAVRETFSCGMRQNISLWLNEVRPCAPLKHNAVSRMKMPHV